MDAIASYGPAIAVILLFGGIVAFAALDPRNRRDNLEKDYDDEDCWSL